MFTMRMIRNESMNEMVNISLTAMIRSNDLMKNGERGIMTEAHVRQQSLTTIADVTVPKVASNHHKPQGPTSRLRGYP